MLFILLIAVYQVYRYLRTLVHIYTSYIFYLTCCNYELKLHLLTLTIASISLS